MIIELKNTIKDIKEIYKHLHIINEELGVIQSDLKWMKRVGYYMTAILTAIFIQTIILGVII